jgi:Ca2+-binding EF-hand superfamily protein
MKNLLVLAAVSLALVLAADHAPAQQPDPPAKAKIQIDPEKIKILQDVIGGAGNFNAETISKMIEQISKGRVQIDPEIFKRLEQRILKKRIEKKGMAVDADVLFRKLDANGDGKLSKDEFLKIADEYREAIGENRLVLARALLGKRYDELDPTGAGLTREQFRAEVARFLQEKAGK